MYGFLSNLAPFLLGGAVFLLVYNFFPDSTEQATRQRLGLTGPVKETQSLLLKIVRPFFLVLEPFTKRLAVPNYRERVKRKFVTASMDELTVDDMIAYKILMGLAVPLFFGLSIPAITDKVIPWWGIILLILFGFTFPDQWLSGRVQARQLEVLMALPYVMDLLTLSVEAGLDFVSAIGKVVDKSPQSPLRDEFATFLQEIQVGNTRQQALRNLAYRLQMSEVRSFVALLVQADELGASIGPVLRAQSDLLRTQRFQRAEKAGAAAAQKILFPLVLCILPAVFIMIFGPIGLAFVYKGGFKPTGMQAAPADGG